MSEPSPIYCVIPIEFIQPWEQNEAIRQVKDLALGNTVMLQGTFHVGNTEEARRFWKERYPQLAAKIDSIPRFPERPEHGMAVLLDLPLEFHIEQLRLCRGLGLQVLCFFPSRLGLAPAEFDRITEASRGVVLTEMFMGENLSILGATLSLEKLKQLDASPIVSHAARDTVPTPAATAAPSAFDDPARLDFQVIHDWFVGRFRRAGEWVKARWDGPLSAIESSSQIRLALEAGADVPVLELVPTEPLRGIAAVRGAARAYGKPLWGVHTAMGYYRAPTDDWTPERLRIAYHLFYAAGASIFSECNLPLRNWGSCSGFFTIPASPPIRWAERECRPFDDPICARAREVVADHYRFTQFHQRPAVWPRVKLGFLTGYLDTMTPRMWFVDHPGFLAPAAAQTWRQFDRAFDSEPWYTAPRQYYWQADPAKPLRHGTPPAGQVDIVPIEAPLEVLQSYGCLALLGWNTMTETHYARLKDYVAAGGTLFLAVPHLSTRSRADQPPAFVRDGDVRDLCGVQVIGPGESIEEVLFEHQASNGRHLFAQGTLYLEPAPLAKLELAGARPLAVSRDRPGQPVLLEHRLGRGVVYLLATWEYPGDRLDAFLTDILRTLAEAEQGDIAVEGRDVFYAVYDGAFPSGQRYSTVYLVNHDIYGQPAQPNLLLRGQRVPLRVEGRGLRIVWVIDELVIAPEDRYAKVSDARRDGSGWAVTLESAPLSPGAETDAERSLQLERLGGRLGPMDLDGRRLLPELDSEGTWTVRARLSARNPLRLE